MDSYSALTCEYNGIIKNKDEDVINEDEKIKEETKKTVENNGQKYNVKNISRPRQRRIASLRLHVEFVYPRQSPPPKAR